MTCSHLELGSFQVVMLPQQFRLAFAVASIHRNNGICFMVGLMAVGIFGRCRSGIVGQLALSEAVMSAVVSFSGLVTSLTSLYLVRVASVLVKFPMCALNLTPRIIP